MTTITRTWGRGPASSDQRRQLILLAVLGVVLALLLVWQLPKLLGGSGSSSGTTATTASEVAPTAIAAPAPTGSAAARTSAAAPGTERWIKRHATRDPFVPLVGNEPVPGATPAAATPAVIPAEKLAAQPATPAVPTTTTPVKVVPAPKIVPTAAVVVTDGHRQVIGLHQKFTLGGTTFELVSVDPKQITIAVAHASFAGGVKKITLDRSKQVSLENAATGVRYSVVFRRATNQTPTTTTTTEG